MSPASGFGGTVSAAAAGGIETVGGTTGFAAGFELVVPRLRCSGSKSSGSNLSTCLSALLLATVAASGRSSGVGGAASAGGAVAAGFGVGSGCSLPATESAAGAVSATEVASVGGRGESQGPWALPPSGTSATAGVASGSMFGSVGEESSAGAAGVSVTTAGELLGHNTYVRSAIASVAARPNDHHIGGVNMLDGFAATTVAADAATSTCSGTVAGAGASSGTSNANSAGMTVLADDDSVTAGTGSGNVAAVIGATPASGFQPAGAAICTMLPHLGQAWI